MKTEPWYLSNIIEWPTGWLDSDAPPRIWHYVILDFVFGWPELFISSGGALCRN